MASVPMNKIERAHQMYREGSYEEALGFYTEALAMAKTKPQKIALHSNRAACYLKLQDFNKAAEECTSVLDLDQKHTGALMLRAQTLVTLKEYHSALFDVNRLIELNPSSEVYRNLHARLKTQLTVLFAQGKSLAPIPEAEAELEEDGEGIDEAKAERDEEEEEKEEDDDDEEKEVEEEEEDKHMVSAKFENIPSVEVTIPQTQNVDEKQNSKGWQAIPQPKGHSRLDYSRWDSVADESSEEDSDDEDDEEESQPRYRVRVRTVGVQPVK